MKASKCKNCGLPVLLDPYATEWIHRYNLQKGCPGASLVYRERKAQPLEIFLISDDRALRRRLKAASITRRWSKGFLIL